MPTLLPTLGNFRATLPTHRVPQAHALAWLAAAHAEAERVLGGLPADVRPVLVERFRKVFARVGCQPDRIATRGTMLDDHLTTRWADHDFYDLARRPHGPGSEARSRRFDELVSAYFVREYADEHVAPRDLIHVTCTGYVAPSAAQKLVAARGWGAQTRVTHAYHMGCYAAIPAVRIAAGCFATASPSAAPGDGRVDLVHTELCSLHLDPGAHGIEQLVVQSLFADGLIRYSMEMSKGPGLRVLATHERVLPSSASAMGWIVGDAGMQMTLSSTVPAQIGGALREFVAELCALAHRDLGSLWGCVAAVHPGGPKIIDAVCQVLELDETQVAASREVLRTCGNMSSATLPHVWMRVLDDIAVAPGRLVLSLAFGPGLTIAGALLEKR